MALKERPRMPTAQRAKQFAPFAALTGFELALKDKEEALLLRPQPLLAPERIEELNQKLRTLQLGQTLSLTYFEAGRDRQISGTLFRLIPEDGCLYIIPADSCLQPDAPPVRVPLHSLLKID